MEILGFVGLLEGFDDVEVCVDDDVSEDCVNFSVVFSESSFFISLEDEEIEYIVDYSKKLKFFE